MRGGLYLVLEISSKQMALIWIDLWQQSFTTATTSNWETTDRTGVDVLSRKGLFWTDLAPFCLHTQEDIGLVMDCSIGRLGNRSKFTQVQSFINLSVFDCKGVIHIDCPSIRYLS